MARARHVRPSRGVEFTANRGLSRSFGVAFNDDHEVLDRPVFSDTPIGLDRRFFSPVSDDIGPDLAGRRVVIADRNVVHPAIARGRVSNPFFLNTPMRSDRQAFVKPRSVVVCVQRAERREVLFAKGKHGGGHRKPRYNSRSTIVCR